MPGETLQKNPHWMPRKPGLFEEFIWDRKVSRFEKNNAFFAIQVGKYANSSTGLRRSTQQVDLRIPYPIQNLGRYLNIITLLKSSEMKSGDPITKDNGIIEVAAVTSAYAWIEGAAAGMNDAYSYFKDIHLEAILEQYGLANGRSNGRDYGREIFNACLHDYFRALPPNKREIILGWK